VAGSFFTFPDRSLKYDCPSCGSQCCKGKGLALEALSQKLLRGEGTLADGVAEALQPFAPHLRSMALSALAFGEANLLVD